MFHGYWFNPPPLKLTLALIPYQEASLILKISFFPLFPCWISLDLKRGRGKKLYWSPFMTWFFFEKISIKMNWEAVVSWILVHIYWSVRYKKEFHNNVCNFRKNVDVLDAAVPPPHLLLHHGAPRTRTRYKCPLDKCPTTTVQSRRVYSSPLSPFVF